MVSLQHGTEEVTSEEEEEEEMGEVIYLRSTHLTYCSKRGVPDVQPSNPYVFSLLYHSRKMLRMLLLNTSKNLVKINNVVKIKVKMLHVKCI